MKNKTPKWSRDLLKIYNTGSTYDLINLSEKSRIYLDFAFEIFVEGWEEIAGMEEFSFRKYGADLK